MKRVPKYTGSCSVAQSQIETDNTFFGLMLSNITISKGSDSKIFSAILFVCHTP